MQNKNKCELRGRLGADVIVRSTNTGRKVANLSIATVESWMDKTSGDWKETTTWHRCEAWGQLAEICGKHGLKGDLVEVEAKIEYRQNEKDGVKYNDAIMVLKTFTRLDRPGAKKDQTERQEA